MKTQAFLFFFSTTARAELNKIFALILSWLRMSPESLISAGPSVPCTRKEGRLPKWEYKEHPTPISTMCGSGHWRTIQSSGLCVGVQMHCGYVSSRGYNGVPRKLGPGDISSTKCCPPYQPWWTRRIHDEDMVASTYWGNTLTHPKWTTDGTRRPRVCTGGPSNSLQPSSSGSPWKAPWEVPRQAQSRPYPGD